MIKMSVMSAELIAGIAALVVFLGSVALRIKTKGQSQVTLNDAIIAAIAGCLALLISGRLDKFVVGSQGTTIETAKAAIISASNQKIAQQVTPVTPLPVARVEEARKGGPAEIPAMIQRGVQALDLIPGFGGYVPDLLRAYLETLTLFLLPLRGSGEAGPHAARHDRRSRFARVPPGTFIRAGLPEVRRPAQSRWGGRSASACPTAGPHSSERRRQG
jgi:hypothetical protein